MKLYLLESDSGPRYDALRAIVVRAESEGAAREMARTADHNADDTSHWLDPQRSTCKVVSVSGAPEVICADYMES